MRKMSFVDHFSDKKICHETLNKLLEVDYQRDILCEIAIEDYKAYPLEISSNGDTFIHLENSFYSIYVIQSTNENLLKKISKISDDLKKEKIVIAFRKFRDLNFPSHIKFIDPLDWMNAIISHGINRKILHLQFMRDLQFDLDHTN